MWGGNFLHIGSGLRAVQCNSLCDYKAGGSLTTVTGQHAAEGGYLNVHTSVHSAVWAEYRRKEVGFNNKGKKKCDKISSEQYTF